MSDLIASDVQGQVIDSPLVTLYEVDLPNGSVIYLHSGLDDDLASVQFRDHVVNSQINTYEPFPILADGFEHSADGAISRPSLTVANVGNIFKQALSGFKNTDLIGQRVIRRQTLKKYLVGESPDLSNPPIELARMTYVIDRISSENNMSVIFELSAIHDLEGVKLPRRTLVGKYCSWTYKGNSIYGKGGCVWPSTSVALDEDPSAADNLTAATKYFHPFFDVNNNVLANASLLTAEAISGLSGSVTQGEIRLVNGEYFQAKYNQNSTGIGGNISKNNDRWIFMRPYTAWLTSTSYTKGDLVREKITVNGQTLDTVWICLRDHTSSATNSPSLSSSVWQQEEMCSKTLEGCKCRFAAVYKQTTGEGTFGGHREALTNGTKHLGVTLPFGSFPGAAKFR